MLILNNIVTVEEFESFFYVLIVTILFIINIQYEREFFLSYLTIKVKISIKLLIL